MAAAGIVTLSLHPTVRALWRGEIDLHGQRVWSPPHGSTPHALARVDLFRVHTELLPDWIALAGRGPLDDAPDEPAAFARLLAQAGQDPNLAAILLELRGHLRTGLHETAGRVHYLLWAWNDYLRAHGQPWVVQGAVTMLDARAVLQVTTYAARAPAAVRVGVVEREIRFLARADATALRESYLGATNRVDDHAFVLIDRVADFAIEEAWPLLAPEADDALPPGARAWAPAIRAEAARAIPAADLDELAATALIARGMRDVAFAVRQRRGCARHRLLRRVAWSGPSDAELTRMSAIAARESGHRCPSITADEAQVLLASAHALRSRPRLPDAIAALVAFSGQHVAIHEARHLADRAQLGGLDEPLDCAACPAGMTDDARGELSGQLAAMAWSPSPALAMLQACLLVYRDADAPHAEAMRLFTTRLGRPCGSGPPPDLAHVARDLEREMLGRSDPIALAPDFPARQPIDLR